MKAPLVASSIKAPSIILATMPVFLLLLCKPLVRVKRPISLRLRKILPALPHPRLPLPLPLPLQTPHCLLLTLLPVELPLLIVVLFQAPAPT